MVKLSESEGRLSWTGMEDSGTTKAAMEQSGWAENVYQVFRQADIRQVAYVPDAGLKNLISLCHGDERMKTMVLTTEEEGVGLLAGAWLGGERGVLLMQSSGVGNCINTLSLVTSCQLPFLTLVTMRGEWSEFNPWQVPMGQAVESCLEASGIIVYRVEEAEQAAEVVEAAIDFVFSSNVPVAVLMSQRMIGRKRWK